MTAEPRACLLVVVAHPDDESIACGATIARAAAAGVRVIVVSLTRGEAGPSAGERGPDALAATRWRELQAAAVRLGAAGVAACGHADGLLPWTDPALVIADISALIEAAAPAVVVTFGADGLYWHPDHVAVHERTTEAVRRLGPRAPALFYVTMPPGQMQALVDADPAHRPAVPGLDDAAAFGADALAPTLVIPAGPFARTKLAAIRCHASQLAASAFAGLPDDDAPAVLAVEHFHRADVGAPGPTLLDALAATAHA